MFGIDPDRGDARVDAALDIRGQAVAHHHGFPGIKVRNPGEAGVKVRFGRLVEADFLRDKHLFKKAVQVGAGQPSLLHGGGAVAGEKQAVFLAQPRHRVLRAGKKPVPYGEISLIGAGALRPVRRRAQFPEQNVKPAGQNLVPGQLPRFQLLPVPFVDFVISCQHRFRGLHAHLPKRLSQGNPLRLVEIQNGVVQI